MITDKEIKTYNEIDDKIDIIVQKYFDKNIEPYYHSCEYSTWTMDYSTITIFYSFIDYDGIKQGVCALTIDAFIEFSKTI